jgi:type IV secretory pathway TrbD component
MSESEPIRGLGKEALMIGAIRTMAVLGAAAVALALTATSAWAASPLPAAGVETR